MIQLKIKSVVYEQFLRQKAYNSLMIHILTIIFNLFYNIGSDNYEIISKKVTEFIIREKSSTRIYNYSWP